MNITYSSVEKSNEFYERNLKWQEDKEKGIRKLQCEKNVQNTTAYTFTPKIVNFVIF